VARFARDEHRRTARSGDGAELFVGEIVAALAELLAEDPEANEILRGRTFARVLH